MRREYTVFVVGAGLSADIGYPLARDLLYELVSRFSSSFRNQLEKVIAFHHPTWDHRWEKTPDIEELLTEISTNEDLLPLLKRRNEHFGPTELAEFKKTLLLEVALMFHEIHTQRSADQKSIVRKAAKKIEDSENPVIISFNWDYELDRALFEEDPRSEVRPKIWYGLEKGGLACPAILKPHGSLNWYLESLGKHLKADLAPLIWQPAARTGAEFEPVHCFLRWRHPVTKSGREYSPWIIPPTHLKSFSHPMLRFVWKRCAEVLTNARSVFFFGYSLPAADWHSRYILRCGFQARERQCSTGVNNAPESSSPSVTIVNPDNSAFQRIEAVVGRPCRWVRKTMAHWLQDGA